MAAGKKSFILYCDQKEVWDELNNEEAGKLIKHLFAYVNDENPELNDKFIKIASLPIIKSLKRDLVKWEEKQKQRSEAGKRSAEKRAQALKELERNSTTVDECKQTSTVNGNVNDSVNGNVNDSVSVKNNKGKRRNFIPPTIDQVKEYCSERKNNVDAQRFIDHYSSNGWMVGKNKMKDWKAAVRTWEKNEKTLFNGQHQENTQQPTVSKTQDAAIGLAKRVAERHLRETGERIPYEHFLNDGN